MTTFQEGKSRNGTLKGFTLTLLPKGKFSEKLKMKGSEEESLRKGERESNPGGGWEVKGIKDSREIGLGG